MISGMNHAVLYVRDARRHQKFYADVLGFTSVIDNPGEPYVFMRAPASQNHHDIAFFTIGEDAGTVLGRAWLRRHVSPGVGGGHARRAGRNA